jgi:hypothetical protein
MRRTLFFKDVPVVIEPGVAALEVAVCRRDASGERLFYVPFGRVEPSEKSLEILPFVISSANPHVFSMSQDLAASPFLLVYDHLGKLSSVYTRDPNNNAWIKNDTAPEQTGSTITQFSVRFSFNSIKSRDKFLRAYNNIVAKQSSGKTKENNSTDSDTIIQLLSKSPIGPVVLPLAIAKPQKYSGV